MLYRFDDYELDIGRYEFRVGSESRPLQPQVFDVLRHLIENRGRLVSRDELISIVWKGRIVSESTIDSRIHAARRAVGDDARRQLRITTVPRRGYRFSAAVKVLDSKEILAAASQDDSRDQSLPINLGPAVVILPFTFLSGNQEQEPFPDVIVDDLITALSKFRSFFVLANNSNLQFKGKVEDVSKTAQELGARYVVQGSVRTEQDRIRINVQLVDGESRKHLWAERFDRELADLLAVQDEMSATIAAALEQEINAAERQRVRRKNPKDLNVWDCYQRGLWHYHLRTREDVEEAGRLFQKVTELDPGFSPAHAWLAEQLRRTVISGWATEPEVMRGQALRAARQAVACDRRNPLVHYSLGRIYSFEGDSEAAIAEFEEALSLNPNMALASSGLGAALVWAGRAKDALSPLQKAIRQNPRDPHRSGFDLMMGIAHFMLKEHEDAVIWLKSSCREASAPYFWPYLGLSTTLSALGQLDESRASLNAVLSIKPDLSLKSVAEFLRGQNSNYNDLYLEGLQKAGLPE